MCFISIEPQSVQICSGVGCDRAHCFGGHHVGDERVNWGREMLGGRIAGGGNVQLLKIKEEPKAAKLDFPKCRATKEKDDGYSVCTLVLCNCATTMKS